MNVDLCFLCQLLMTEYTSGHDENISVEFSDQTEFVDMSTMEYWASWGTLKY